MIKKFFDKLGQVALNQLCVQLTAGLHQGNPTDALDSTIATAGELLSDPLTRAGDDVNELEDTLVLIDS